jgi:hypothetical protein
VAGGDELPFWLAGGQAAALESRDAAQELDAGEHGLDDVLALSVSRCARTQAFLGLPLCMESSTLADRRGAAAARRELAEVA